MPMHFPTVPIAAAPREALLKSGDRFRPMVMVVDDDPLITQTLAAILKGSGLAVITAPDGFAALELAMIIPPEIVITDIAMPGLNGVDLAFELTRAISDCDVIFFSGQTTTADVAGRMRNTGVNFLTLGKPVHPADLLDAVFELLDRRGHSMSLPKPFRRPSLNDLVSSARPLGSSSPVRAGLVRRERPRLFA